MSIYSEFCFQLIVQCVVLCLFYCVLFKLYIEDRILYRLFCDIHYCAVWLFQATLNLFSFGPYANEDELLILQVGNWDRQTVKGNVSFKLSRRSEKPIFNSHVWNNLHVYSTTTFIANVSAYHSSKSDFHKSSWISNLRSPAKFLAT